MKINGMQRPSGGCQNCGGSVRTYKDNGWVCAPCNAELNRQAEIEDIETAVVAAFMRTVV